MHRLLWLIAGTTALTPVFSLADPLPTGGTVVKGDVAIATPGTTQMTITQRSDRAVVNWNSFSIGRGAHVDIRQPSQDSAILNRVTGSTDSQIHGRLTANGQVHLVNPNGIFIGRTGIVDSGAFVGSTLDTTDEDFTAGRLRYSGNGTSKTVENAGRITIVPGGYAALIGGRVKNSGMVTVPMGRVGFAAGERVTLDLSGDQFLQVALPSDVGDDMDALIENTGTVSAEGGLIEMRAAAARAAARNAINLSGVAEARSVSGRSGAIILGGSGGNVSVSGRVSTRARDPIVTSSLRPRARGGDITVTGTRIALEGAVIDASGQSGGGLIRVGGDFAGKGPLPRARQVTVDADTHLAADGGVSGNGGRIAIWSDRQTHFNGTMSARGGETGGVGGFIEVSSAQELRYRGFADLRANSGAWGTLLLDPADISVPGTIDEATLEAGLEAGNFTLDTFDEFGTDPGDITIDVDVDWGASTRLSLTADRNVFLNGAINGPNGELNIDVGNLIVAGNPDADVNVDRFLLESGTWSQITPVLPTFSANNFELEFGTSFLRFSGGNGEPANPFEIVDVFGLQGLEGAPAGRQYILVNDIDASGTEGWADLDFVEAGFRPISSFDGSLDGNGFSIFDLIIDGTGRAALIDTLLATGSISNLDVVNANVQGTSGAILVVVNSGTVSNVSVSGIVNMASPTGGAAVGGLVRSNDSLIEDSDSSAEVNLTSAGGGGGLSGIGGLVGNNIGTINRSHATGNVTVNNSATGVDLSVGGFVGIDTGQIDNSYALGNVAVNDAGTDAPIAAGGFAGRHNGEIDTSFSTGSVVVTGAAANIGGFAGLFDGIVSPIISFDPGLRTTFWDTETSGLTTSDGGIGLTTAEFQNTDTFLALGRDAGWDFGTTWAPGDTGFYPVLYTTSAVVFAEADPLTLVYGTTAGATATGTTAGGTDTFLRGPEGDSLDTDAAFAALSFSDETVGERSFTIDTPTLTSAEGTSYRVVSATGSATITPAPLTITANDRTHVYGVGTIFDGTGFVTEGLVRDDTVTSVTIASPGAAPFSNVAGSPYAITPSDAIGTGLGNYDITYVAGELTVTPAPLTITANDRAHVYGIGTVFDGTGFATEGLIGEDNVTSVTMTSVGAVPSAGVTESPYAITPSDAIGSGVGNYDITYVAGELTVTPAPLTITAQDQEKTFGETFVFAGTEFTAGELLFDDSVTSATISSEGAAADATIEDSPYAISITGATGSGIENYDITYVDGALTVVEGVGSSPVVVNPPPPAVVTLPNPSDPVTIAFEGQDGGTTVVNEPARAGETLTRVRGTATLLEVAARACGESSADVTRYLACLSDALNDFSNELDAISTDLPPALANVAAIINEARVGVDRAQARANRRLAGATTEAERAAIAADAIAEARAAVQTAGDEIRKSIALIRAEDPELVRLQTDTINTIVRAVETVDIELSRVTDL